ncbi:uncharacterized protein LOC126911722 isoform X2 [Spodoptera frugiperda]|uniref:Uncharacterized protein LOC126911722 isoform X2 n=1 Tax=Spodoptera frugiperda TaxID=7108 RepID=A0A9R0EZS0_SPOFR|nr:uncharacterized protein LOC126911722 isoform X2 [Spodoptera frugiperda]
MINESASGEQLRRLWQNLKTRQRDALTRERQHRMATGGGGPCPDADINPNIAEISPALFVEIQDTLDSDHIEVETVQEETFMETNVPPPAVDSPIQNPEITIQPNPTISHSTIQSVESNPELLSSNEKKLRVQILKAEHVSREKRAEELHKLQLKCILEKHNLEIQIMAEKLKEAKAKAESAQHHQ